MQKPLKIAILDMYNNVAGEGMRCIINLVNEFQEREQISVETTIFNVRANNEIPDLSFDIFISTGGPGSPLPSEDAWENPYFDFVDSVFAHNNSEAGEIWGKYKKVSFLNLPFFSISFTSFRNW